MKGISIVVPARDAEGVLGGCIEALLGLDYPADRLEIIVVDNGSSDRTAEIIAAHPVIGLSENIPGAAAARNRGVTRASFDVVAFTDADCEVSSEWAREIEHSFEAGQADAVMGYTEGAEGNFWARLEQANFEAFWFRELPDGRAVRRIGVDTRNCALRKSVLDACGGFDARLTDCEDLDLSVRLRQGGYRIVCNDRMRARHRNRTDLGQILRIKRRHARAFLQIVARQPDGLACPDLPCDYRRFLGVDNLNVSGVRLKAAHIAFRWLREVLALSLRAIDAFGARPWGLAVRLFKTLCGVVWEIEILDATRRGGACVSR